MKDLAEKTLWLIPLLPLLGFLVNGLLGKRLPRAAVAGVACLLPAASFGLSCLAAWCAPVAQGTVSWISTGGISVDFALKVDALSAVMILVVTGVGTLIHIYSIGYMRDDPGIARYFAYLNLFMFAMLVLVLADNLLLMFVGWEGVGLCSYLLIGFWFKDLKNADAGKKAFIVNRVGDFGFILGTVILLGVAGTMGFEGLGSVLPSKFADHRTLLTAAALLLFLGACGKSAQIPLYVWLPDAMAGPTPVSALIHAATMVTAGVYMMGRMHVLYALAADTSGVIVMVAAATALLSALIAVAQNDIKKILAYSTISQLGFMFAGMATGYFGTGIFHVVTHAFFKALLFLGAGAIIHALHGEQDIRKMGGLAKTLPAVFIVFLIGAVALMGAPGSAGYFSKDAILAAVGARTQDGLFGVAWMMLLGTAFLTAFYTMRMVVLVFYGAPADPESHPHKPGPVMMAPLAILAVLSLVGGVALEGRFSPESGFIPMAGDAERVKGALEAYHHAHGTAAALSWGLFFGGALTAFVLYGFRRNLVKAFVESEPGRGLHALAGNKFYVDELYERTIVTGLRRGAGLLWSVIDRRLIDGILVDGTARVAYAIGSFTRRLHTGAVVAGAAAILAGVLGLLGWLLSRAVRSGGL